MGWKASMKLSFSTSCISMLDRIRVRPLATSLFGYRYQRARRRIEIDITYACNLSCFNCNRSCTQAPTGERMTVHQIELFVEESKEKGIKWEQIRLTGGEPTLHPTIFEILNRLIAYRESFSKETIITVVTNGYGKKVESVLKNMPPQIKIENSHKTSGIQPSFDTFNVAPQDLKEHQGANFRNACWISAYCGIGLTSSGYYPCAPASGIDRIFGWNLGRQELPDDEDSMYDMLEAFCSHCGHFKRGRIAQVKQPVMSLTWREAYERYRQAKPKLTCYGQRGPSGDRSAAGQGVLIVDASASHASEYLP
jgi:hypothetical protein